MLCVNISKKSYDYPIVYQLLNIKIPIFFPVCISQTAPYNPNSNRTHNRVKHFHWKSVSFIKNKTITCSMLQYVSTQIQSPK